MAQFRGSVQQKTRSARLVERQAHWLAGVAVFAVASMTTFGSALATEWDADFLDVTVGNEAVAAVDSGGNLLVAASEHSGQRPVLLKISGGSGREVWRASLGVAGNRNISQVVATDDDDTVVLIASTGEVALLSGDDGVEVWRRMLPDAYPSGIEVHGSAVFVAGRVGYQYPTAEGFIEKLDLSTGNTEWHAALSVAGQGSSPTLPFVVGPSGDVITKAGQSAWPYQNITKLDGATGASLWQSSAGGCCVYSFLPLLVDATGAVIVLGGGDGPFALDSSGGLLWEHDPQMSLFDAALVGGTDMVAQGYVYPTFEDRLLTRIGESGYLWTTALPWSSSTAGLAVDESGVILTSGYSEEEDGSTLASWGVFDPETGSSIDTGNYRINGPNARLSGSVFDGEGNVFLLARTGFLSIHKRATTLSPPDADSDGDGVADGIDNCILVPNTGQADFDWDLLGDECDPYPFDVDHEKAACFEALAGGDDADGDGVGDLVDQCNGSDTTDVDLAGCTIEQFCSQIDVTTSAGRGVCKKRDWKNDEPVMRGRDRDCNIERNQPGRADDECVPAGSP